MACESRDESPVIEVRCQPQGDGYRCLVTVGDDPGATEHDVAVSAASLASLAPGAQEPEELVCESFRFLLEHEPRASILSQFELPIIARYFPDYAQAMAERFGR
jgi:hypothetical protein